MRWRWMAACAAAAGSLVGTGCGSARFVRCDQAGGTVAIRSNTNEWPTYYRDKAEELLRRKCPNGYEIVREEEVVTGQVSHTNAQTQTKEAPTVLVGGGESSVEKRGNRKDAKDAFGGLAIPVGEAKQTTNQTTTFHDVTEWRIEYRAK